MYGWYSRHVSPTEPRRTGAVSLTVTDAHHDGGFASGIFGFGNVFQFWIQPADVDEPDTDYSVALERCTWVDRAGVQGPSVAVLHVFPDIPDQSFRMDIAVVASSVADSVALSAGHLYDGGIMYAKNGRGNTLVAPGLRRRNVVSSPRTFAGS